MASHQRHHGLARGLGAGNHRRQFGGLDDLGIAGNRRRDEIAAELLEPIADRCRFLDRDGRAVDDDLRHRAALRRDAVLAEQDLVEVLAGRHDGKQDVDAFEVRQVVDDLAALGRERLGLGARAVPDRDVVAGLEQALGHRKAHAAHADPADFLCVVRHQRLLTARSATPVICGSGLVHGRGRAPRAAPPDGCGAVPHVCANAVRRPPGRRGMAWAAWSMHM